MAVLLSDPDISVQKLRQLISDHWHRPVFGRAAVEWQAKEERRQAAKNQEARMVDVKGIPLPARDQPRTGVKPVGDTMSSDALPPQLRELAKRMGGVPAWWNGSGTAGELAVPDSARVGPVR